MTDNERTERARVISHEWPASRLEVLELFELCNDDEAVVLRCLEFCKTVGVSVYQFYNVVRAIDDT